MEQEIIIDNEFKFLLPILDEQTYAALEKSILEHGCRDALVTWNDILIDGYNRYQICMENEIPFTTISMEFESRENVIIWMISNQISRRNLTPMQLSHFRGLHYRTEKKIVTNPNGINKQNLVVGHNDQQPNNQSTSGRLADKYRVSPKTITRDAKVSEALDIIGEISPEAKAKILSGDVNIDKKALVDLAAKPDKADITELALMIEEGTYEKKKPATDAPAGDDHYNKMINNNLIDTAQTNPTDGSLDPTYTEAQLFVMNIVKVTDDFSSILSRSISFMTKEELRIKLKTHVVALQNIYSRL